MKQFLLYLLIGCACAVHAQQVNAWVYFKDKSNVAASIVSPQNILTQRAIQRKARHGVVINAQDVPVNQSYVQQVKNTAGITYVTQSKWFNCMHITGTTTDINALLNLSFVDRVVYADPSLRSVSVQPISKFSTQVTPPLNYGNAATQVQMIGLESLHNQGYTGNGMLIAVTDSGFPSVDVNAGFAQLRSFNAIAGGYDFVAGDNTYIGDHWHGTRVLSIMAGNDPGNFEGTAPDAQYLLYRTEDAQNETPAEMSYWVAAAERADSLGVDVINVSLGYLGFDNTAESLSYADMDGQTAFISRGAQLASEKGIVVVAAAGNSGNSSVHPYIAAPADAPGVFTIGAVNGIEQRTSFSSTGPTADARIKPDIMAMGGGTSIINENGQVISGNGTSYSAPVISGAVACLLQAFPQMTPSQIMNAIRSSASQASMPDQLMGYGVPDFNVVLQTLSVDAFLDHAFTYYVKDKQLFIESNESLDQTITIYDLSGKQVSKDVLSGSYVKDMSAWSHAVYIVQLGDKQFKIALH